MEYLKMIPIALYEVFRGIVWLLSKIGVLFLLGIPAFLLCWIPQVSFGWGPGTSLIVSYILVLLIYIGYKLKS